MTSKPCCLFVVPSAWYIASVSDVILIPYVALLYSHSRSSVIAQLFRLDAFKYSAACAMGWNAVGGASSALLLARAWLLGLQLQLPLFCTKKRTAPARSGISQKCR